MQEHTLDFNDLNKFSNQIENLLEKIDETELILIKCHLLIEFSMNSFIASHSKNDHKYG